MLVERARCRVVDGVLALDHVDEHIGSLAAHFHATLLHCGELWVAGHGTVAVGETAYLQVAGHVEPHAFGCVEHAYGRVVVDAEEAVGPVFASEQARGGALGLVAVVAYLHQALVEIEATVHQGIFVAVVAVLAYLHVQRRAEEGHTPAPPPYEIVHRPVAALVVVDHHAAAVDAGAYSVVEHKGHAVVDEILEVVIFLGVLGLAHDDAAHLVLV